MSAKRSRCLFRGFVVSVVAFHFLPGYAISQIPKTTPAQTETVWLGSLDIAKMSSGWGKTVAGKSVQNQTLSIGGQKFTEGVGTHANSVMYIDLNRTAKRFTAYVGVDDEVRDNTGSIKFRVFGDDRELFNSGIIKAGQAAHKVDVDLSGVKTLILIVNSAGDGIAYDHADWAQAKFEIVGAKPQAIDRPEEKAVILTPKPAPRPKINGPKVFGVRPGRPFIYRIPATGKRSMTFKISNLPEGLKLNPQTGIITGNVPKQRGEYVLTLKATNAHGSAERPFTIVVGDTLALTPPMGWNSWYIHYHRVTDQNMREAADAMVESGMADFGYMYVNIDDCWMKKRQDEPYRDENGAVLCNAKFPDMKAMTDYIHSKGLRAGTYISPGPWTCAGYVGSYQHEEIDARKFAEWGFDFLKYDWCSYGQIAKDNSLAEFMKPYQLMGDILKNLDRDLVLNLCQYGMGEVWKWGGKVGGHCWRTTGDLGLSPSFMQIGLSNARHHEYAQPGQWNDPDYILIGWVGNAHQMGEGQPTTLSPNQQYAYMSMWSLMAAPLIFSGEMTKLDEFTLNVLCNAEVIEVDQDPLGQQAKIISQTDDQLILAKDMEDGSKAVGLFNNSEIDMRISVKWSDLGIKGKHRARDLWRQKDIGFFTDQYEAKVPRHGVIMIRLFLED
jgi:alpha-galactosidase